MSDHNSSRVPHSLLHRTVLIGGCALASLSVLGCAALDNSELGGSESTSGNGGSGGSASDGSGGFEPVGSGGSGGGVPCDSTVADADGDGWTAADGDCNDCDVNVNPGAVEVATLDGGSPADENCDGEIDEAIPTCDAMLGLSTTSAIDAARAMELCTDATPGGKDYGVLDAMWVRADGTMLDPAQAPQFGIQPNFGSNVSAQAGDALLVLSSGFARLPGQPDVATNNSASALGYSQNATPPSGFPQQVPGCDGGTDIYDDVGLQLNLRAPTNATGLQYLFKFYSFEFAEWVCTTFNDQFIALVTPPPMGSVNGNISFDTNGNPVSVNIAFFDVCDPVANNDYAALCFGSTCPPMPNPYCPMGPAELAGTGFDDTFGSNYEDAGATQWLQTTAPIGPGEEFTIRLAVWDTGDTAYDSTVLLDGFEWVATPGTKVGTKPPVPK